MKPLNILITGANGFIGSYLSNLLDTPDNNIKKVISNEIDWILNVGRFEKEPMDIIYHLAAYSRVPGSNLPENNVFEKNVLSLKRSLEFARKKNAKLIFTSTSYCNTSNDANYYAFSKYLGEQLCKFYHKTYGVDVVITRLFNVYGNELKNYPEWKLGVVDKFLLDKRLCRDYTINNGGYQKRDYIHVSDVCNALQTLACSTTNPEIIYEIGTGELTSVNDIAKMIFKSEKFNVNTTEGEILHSKSLGGLDKMRNLGWSPKIKLESYIESIINASKI